MQYVDTSAAAIKFHKAINQRKERIVAALSDVLPGMENSAHLAHEDVAGTDLLAAKTLHTAALRVGIAAVAAGSLTFLMSHLST